MVRSFQYGIEELSIETVTGIATGDIKGILTDAAVKKILTSQPDFTAYSPLLSLETDHSLNTALVPAWHHG
ncbi:MAG: hypothetical protein EOP04_27905 [Proteobacteria bacterium]|nr:MAG: hypothetical protein EOP04_27905 [Pseudomonadota bacterium]